MMVELNTSFIFAKIYSLRENGINEKKKLPYRQIINNEKKKEKKTVLASPSIHHIAEAAPKIFALYGRQVRTIPHIIFNFQTFTLFQINFV